MRFDDMGHLSARLSANCQRQTAYLLLAEMSRAPINPWTRSKRDDRQEGHARGARTSGCCYAPSYSRWAKSPNDFRTRTIYYISWERMLGSACCAS